MLSSLTFITSNSAKADQIARYLDFPIKHHKLDLKEIQSLDLDEIVKAKVKEAYMQLLSPILVEDTSLTFNVLGKLPGPLIKFFLHELKNEGLCSLLDHYPDRSAVAEVTFGLHTGKEVKLFNSKIKGKIAAKPRGPELFGFDPIFIPEGSEKTWAEMSKEEKDQTSMRKGALMKIEQFLIT